MFLAYAVAYLCSTTLLTDSSTWEDESVMPKQMTVKKLINLQLTQFEQTCPTFFGSSNCRYFHCDDCFCSQVVPINPTSTPKAAHNISTASKAVLSRLKQNLKQTLCFLELLISILH
jgi:hypothetical protein